MDLEDRLVTATPEGVSVEMVLAGAGSRFGAILLDCAIQGVVLFVGILFAQAMGAATGSFLVGAGVASVAAFVALFGYFVVLETLGDGRTPGKRAAGLRCVRLDGRPIGFLQSVVRTALRLVDCYVSLGLVGVTSILATGHNQRLGDLAAGTVVVRERRVARLGALATTLTTTPGAPVPVVSAYAEPLDARGWDVTAVSDDQLAVVQRFLRGRFGYAPAARVQLAERLAAMLAPSVAGDPGDLPAERFLEGVVAAKVGGGWAVPYVTAPPAVALPLPPPAPPDAD